MICSWFALLKVFGKHRFCKSIIIEGCPILQTELLCRCSCRTLLLNFFRPVIGFLNNLKLNCGIRVANLIQLNFNEEKANVFVCMVIQPFDSGAVFFSGTLDNPDNNISAFAGGICNQLAEVIVISVFKLIFNNNFSVSITCFSDKSSYSSNKLLYILE